MDFWFVLFFQFQLPQKNHCASENLRKILRYTKNFRNEFFLFQTCLVFLIRKKPMASPYDTVSTETFDPLVNSMQTETAQSHKKEYHRKRRGSDIWDEHRSSPTSKDIKIHTGTLRSWVFGIGPTSAFRRETTEREERKRGREISKKSCFDCASLRCDRKEKHVAKNYYQCIRKHRKQLAAPSLWTSTKRFCPIRCTC